MCLNGGREVRWLLTLLVNDLESNLFTSFCIDTSAHPGNAKHHSKPVYNGDTHCEEKERAGRAGVPHDTHIL